MKLVDAFEFFDKVRLGPDFFHLLVYDIVKEFFHLIELFLGQNTSPGFDVALDLSEFRFVEDGVEHLCCARGHKIVISLCLNILIQVFENLRGLFFLALAGATSRALNRSCLVFASFLIFSSILLFRLIDGVSPLFLLLLFEETSKDGDL